MRKGTTAWLAGSALLLGGCGITGNYRNDLGYADFDSPGVLDTDRELGLSIGAVPLKLARWIMPNDAELAPLLRDLRAVRVYSYEVERDPANVARRIRDVQSDLTGDGWLSLVTLHDDGELLSVLVRTDDRGRTRGMTVIAQDPEEVVLINLIGRDIKLEWFNGYMAELDIDAPQIEIDPETLQARRL